MSKILILGAGPAGLGAAWNLKEQGFSDFAVYEKLERPGGLARSFTTEKGFTFDAGGHVLFSSEPLFKEMLKDMSGRDITSFARSSWIRMCDRFIPYPLQNNIHLLPEEEALDCVLGALDVFSGRSRKKPANFGEWALATFGSGLCRHFMFPYNSKVWAVPLEIMNSAWIGSRVSVIDLKQILKSLIFKKTETEWGPNATFSYPLHGGFGRIFRELARSVGEEKIFYNKEALRIDAGKKEIEFSSGEKVSYDFLLSTMPLNELLLRTEGIPRRAKEYAPEFLWNSLVAVGVGVRGSLPRDKHWIYFPEKNFPFYRVTQLSNYSPFLTPGEDCFSLLAEVSVSGYAPRNSRDLPEEVMAGLTKAELIPPSARHDILDVWVHEEKYSYPIPFLRRDRVLERVIPLLKSRNILSFGRFGLWKYEEGNTDHSFLQGVRAAQSVIS